MRRSWLVAAAVAFFLGMVAVRWDARTGFTSLLRFGESSSLPRVPALSSVPIATVPGTGYDGQYYSQLAVALRLRDPAVWAAIDSASYRARRLLLIATAHLLGFGNASLTLEVYALQNVVIWLALGWCLWRELASVPKDRAAAIWCACMLSLGSLDSVRMGLVDLAPVLLLAWGVSLVRSGRQWTAMACLALAGLARETSLVGGALLFRRAANGHGSIPARRGLGEGALRWALAAIPVIAWAAWLARNVPGPGVMVQGNLDWPAAGLVRSWATCAAHIADGNLGSRWVFGLLGGLSLAFQSVSLIARPRWSEPWWRVGAGFAVLFWFLGGSVWKGYWAAARVVLPMTFAFNVLSPRDRWFWIRMSAANLPLVVHGIWRMLPPFL
jgi:hypothetical protein